MHKLEVGRFMAIGFCMGAGFMAAQELWWTLTGLVGLCHG